MGQRNSDQKKSVRLSIKKETLRALQLRPLGDDQLRAVAGGMSGTCSLVHCDEAPSCRGC